MPYVKARGSIISSAKLRSLFGGWALGLLRMASRIAVALSKGREQTVDDRR